MVGFVFDNKPSTSADKEQREDFEFRAKQFKSYQLLYMKHQVRAVYEGSSRGICQGSLQANQIWVTCDWKMKWLAMLFRESMVQFFGKSGIAWHGMMVIRLATPSETAVAGAGAGSLRCQYIDSVGDDAKECGFNVQSQMEAGLLMYKKDPSNAHINEVKGMDFDGARCYVGKYLAAAIPLLSKAVGMPICMVTIGESGCNKTEQDGHFASEGGAVGAVVARGGHDVHDARTLMQAKAEANSHSTFSMHVRLHRDKAGELKSSALASGIGISKSHFRFYKYDKNIQLTMMSIYTHRSLHGEFEHESTCTHYTYDQWCKFWTQDTPPPCSTGCCVVDSHSPGEAARPMSAFKTASEKAEIQAPKQKKQKQTQGTIQAEAFRRIAAGGIGVCPVTGCTRVFTYPGNLQNHIDRGEVNITVHCVSKDILRHGQAGIDQNCTLTGYVAGQIQNPTGSGIAGLDQMFTKEEDEDMVIAAGDGEYTLIDGTTWTCAAVAYKWAAHSKRGRGRSYTEGQMGFINWCYALGCHHKGDKMSASTAADLMTLVGTLAFNSKFPPAKVAAADWKYPATAISRPIFRAKHLLDHWVIRPWFSQQKATFLAKIKAEIEVAQQGVAGQLGKDNVPALREKCTELGMDTKGAKKDGLIKLLVGYFEKHGRLVVGSPVDDGTGGALEVEEEDEAEED